MTWLYHQKTGELLHDGVHVGAGYSGHGPGLNNPALEADPGIGPIPAGRWKIGPAHDSPHTGPLTMNLDPVGHDALGRTLFRMHGDSNTGNESASRGCPVMGRLIRQAVADSPDRDLEVIA